MGVNLSGSTPTTPGTPGGIAQAIHDAIAAAGGIGSVIAGVFTGIVGGLVGAVQSIAGLIGNLFSLGRQDMTAVDQARVDGENAIVANMSSSLEYLDEIQRVGAAYMDVPTFRVNQGENYPHHIPLTAMYPLSVGARLIPPVVPLTHSAGFNYPSVLSIPSETNSLRPLAQGCGQMELLESGLWLIHFQAAVLQGSAYPDRPADVWCHVTAAESEWLPLGPPEVGIEPGAPASKPGEMAARSRITGVQTYRPVSEQVAYGRAASYVGDRQSDFAGGNTISGLVVAYLPTGGWKVNLSCNSWEKASGPMSTYVYATKVNSETLRQDIDQLKADIAAALPGQNVDMLMDEASIAAMVAEADAIDVLSEEPEP